MGHRLSKIYTRTGDGGDTGLGDGQRVDKDTLRVEAYGTVDELNSLIGMVLAHDLPAHPRETLIDVQHDLFVLGGDLCIPGRETLRAHDILRLEHVLDTFNADLAPLKEFILPAGGLATATCHLARAVCRRAERRVVSLHRTEPVGAQAIPYLNRLSDLLFVLARVIIRHEAGTEVCWQPERAGLRGKH